MFGDGKLKEAESRIAQLERALKDAEGKIQELEKARTLEKADLGGEESVVIAADNPAWKPIVGRSFTPDTFDAYCHGLAWTAWRPSFVALHNTATPNLAQRPNGFTRQHIDNLVGYYRDQQRWKAGPHLFIDDRQIWVFTPLTVSGRHSPSWNKTALGVEMLGNYASDPFNEGRGKGVRDNAVAALATLHAVLGLDPATLRLHKEDPATTHRGCPGANVVKDEVIAEIRALIATRHAGDHAVPANIA